MALIGLSLLFASFIVVCLRPPAWLPGFLAGLRQKTLGGPTIRPLIKPAEPQDDKERRKKSKPHEQEKEQQQSHASSVKDIGQCNKNDNDKKVDLAPPPIIIATEPVQDTVVEDEEDAQAEDQQTTPRAVPTIFQVDGENSSNNDVVPILITPDPSSPPKILEAAPPPINMSSMQPPPQLNVISEPPATTATASSLVNTRSMPPPPVPFNKQPSKSSDIPQPSSSSTTSSLSTSSLPSRRVPTLNHSVSPAPARERNLPIPRRGAAPPSSSSSLGASLLPPPTATSVPKKPSRAVTLEPGHSPLDWARLAQSPTSDLRNLPPNTPYLRVTPSMLREQNGRKGRDAWTAYGGKVYNVSPYVPFHPGGKGELLRGAGKDGTRLFAEVHPWVNYETMLQSCLIGLLVEEHETVNEMEEMD